ncbi:hypothetical protein G7Y79_00005g016810 [Physcia stellaris]|nr:hypothetical protein G7Y79_00005g016810 [Physcia stellaris]
MSDKHVAAVIPAQGVSLTITTIPTPTPGPSELLISVHSIALNPIDVAMRDTGFMISTYPAIIGSDIAGTVISTGSSVPSDAPGVGSRVAAFAPCFFKRGAPEYGAFQKKVIVPAATAVRLPDHVTMNEGALLPMAVQTAWAGFYSIGMPLEMGLKAPPNVGMLIWGAGGSVGSATVQAASLLGFRVFATASAKHHEYLKGLGAARMFDYKDENVVDRIVDTAREDRVRIYIGYDAVGAVKQCLEVLKRLNGDGAKLATTVPLKPDSPKMDGVDIVFVAAPNDETERLEFSRFVFQEWLEDKLATGAFKPSPTVKVIERGFEGLNQGLDELKKGVSGVKFVVEV